MSTFANNVDMENKEPLLDSSVSFRAAQKLVDEIEAYRRMRRLPKMADAARELMESATSSAELLNAANEARALGLNPLAMLRERMAQLSAS